MPELTLDQFKQQSFDGIPAPFFVRPRQEIQEQFKIRPETDIIVATYQKSGTTWTQNILRHLLWPNDTSDKTITDRVPWINVQADNSMGASLEDIETWPNPRVFKTHDPAEWIDDIVGGSNAKIIFVYRNAKDVAVSFYKHMFLVPLADSLKFQDDVTFQDFYQRIFRNPARCTYGLWESHLSGYLAQRDKRKMLVLRFEDMKENLPREIRKIADFIGVEYDDELIETVAVKTDFNYMKNDPTCNYSHYYKDSSFMRSGKVGGWEEYLTSEQAAELDQAERKVYEKFSIV